MIQEYYRFIKEYFKLSGIKSKYIIASIVSALFYKGFALLLPLIAAWIIRYLINGDADATYLCVALLFVTYILYSVSLYINYRVYGFNMSYCYDKMQTKILDKLTTVDNNFTRFISKGRLMNSVNADVADIGDMNDRISEVITGLLQILAIFVIVALYNVWLSIAFVAFSLAFVIVKNRFDRHVNIYTQKVIVQNDKYSNLLTQMTSGLQEIKTLNILDKFMDRLDIIQRRFIKHYSARRNYYVKRDIDVKAIRYIFQFVLYLALIMLVASGNIDISVLVLMISYFGYVVFYIEDMIESTAKIREVNVSVNRVNDILNYDSEIIAFGDLDAEDINGTIELRGVSLKLENTDILKNINLRINTNQVVAIVGEAGSGKTMMFNLILRLVKPSSGTIKIDNVNIFAFSKEAYSHSVSIVNQKPFIFNMSIRKNLDFVDTNIRNQIEACKRAGIHDFIETLPNGYNTILRENGSNISGGQKQMISIARTILSDADILLLDDITTSLDPDTAKLVPKLVDDLKKDHTIIMITKKPDLMGCADRIVVLDKGKIVGDGTHDKLIKNNEVYRTLHARKSPSETERFDDV